MPESKSTIVWKGKYGSATKTVIKGVADLATLTTLEEALLLLSDAAIVTYSFSVNEVLDAVPGAQSNTDRKGVAYFQDVETGNVIRISIPAIKAANCELVPGKNEGERIKETVMTSIQGLLETATSKDLRPLEGVVLQRK